jgi:hypothetical protein
MTDIVNSKNPERKFKRLSQLSTHISKYADLWGSSDRLMAGWMSTTSCALR